MFWAFAGTGLPSGDSSVATPDGRSHNINADTVAGELAAALEAEKLILLTDTLESSWTRRIQITDPQT